MSLKDKIALVTGAARGIGQAVAIMLARQGVKVILVDLSPCKNTMNKILDEGLTSYDFPADITKINEVQNVVKEVNENIGNINILVNNAGIIHRGSFIDLKLEDWHRVLSVNLDGTFHCCLAVVPNMISQGGGKIINITSIAGIIGDITASPVYGTSKGAINTFTKSLARQLAGYGITVNAVAPHAIETDMSREWTEEKRKEVINSIPLKRLGKPEEVAEAVIFLASSGADFITGEVLNINGGYLMH